MVRSSELSSANFQSVASDGLMAKVSGSRCTSMSHAWCARIRPVRWLLKYMSTLGTASTNWMRRVSAAFWAHADGARAVLAPAMMAVRRDSFTQSLPGLTGRRLRASNEASFAPPRGGTDDCQTDRQGPQRCARQPQGLEGGSGPRCHPEELQVRRLHPGLRLHDARGAGGRKGRPPSGMVQCLQSGGDRAVD